MNETSWRYPGWRVVAACFVLAVSSWGFGFYGHGVYLAELRRLHGWSTGLISGATTVYYLVGGVLVAYAADVMARIGPRRLVLLGFCAMAGSAMLVPHVTQPWQLYAVYVLMAVGWASGSLGAIVNVVGLWFVARRGMAISLALNGASASSVLVVPAMVALGTSHGFAFAVAACGAVLAVLFVPMALLWVGRPDRAAVPAGAPGSAPHWSRSQALRSPAFWSASLPFALAIAAQAGFLTHQISVLEPLLPGVKAGYAVAVTGACAIAGRVSLSFFIDAWNPRVATAVLLVLQAGALWVVGHSQDERHLYAACAAFGLGVGNLITLPALVVQREFPANVFGQVASLSTAVAGLTYAFAPGLLGALRDLGGDYSAPLYTCIGLELVAAVIVLTRVPAARK